MLRRRKVLVSGPYHKVQGGKMEHNYQIFGHDYFFFQLLDSYFKLSIQQMLQRVRRRFVTVHEAPYP